MKKDPSIIEEELRKLVPAPLDEALLARLEASADGAWTEFTQDEIRFEILLKECSPSKLSPDFLACLENITTGVHFPVNEKILLFPQGSGVIQKRENRSFWGAAAAVALIGAATALLVSSPRQTSASTQAANNSALPFAANSNSGFVPAGFERGVSEVHDEGVVWKSNNAPHRIVRVDYMDHATFKDANGRTLEVEQPRVKFMLVPTNPD